MSWDVGSQDVSDRARSRQISRSPADTTTSHEPACAGTARRRPIAVRAARGPRVQLGGQLGDGRRRKPEVTEHVGGHSRPACRRTGRGRQAASKHEIGSRTPRAILQRKVAEQHARRAQSAAICALSRSSDSNARSSRSRCTKPTRTAAP